MPSFTYITTPRSARSVKDAAPYPPLGRTVAFANGRRVVSPAGDYVVLSGPPALDQRIEHRMITDPNEYTPDASYGAGWVNAVNKPASAAKRDQLAAAARDQLSYERGVASVEEASVTPDPDVPGRHRGLVKYTTVEGEVGEATMMIPRRA